MTHSTLKTTHLYQHSNGTHAVILLLFWALVFAGEAFRRAPLDATLEFWTILPPLLFPVWLHHKWDLFLWTKTLTLIPIATIWCSIIRFRIDARWTRLGSFAILSVNIAEAFFKDCLSKQGTWNRLNALSGLLLILKVLPSLDALHIREDEPFDVLWSLGPCWIIAYTFWNWMFVFANYDYSIGRHTAVLLAPLALACRNGYDTWIEARCYTLAFYFMIRGTVYERLRAMTDVKVHGTTEQVRLMQVAFLACVVILLAINNCWHPMNDVVWQDVLQHQGQACLQDNATLPHSEQAIL